MLNELNAQIGCRVRRLRSEQKLSREGLSEKCELSTQFLADIESGRKSMTTTSLWKVARALSVSYDYLLFGSCEEKNLTVLMEKVSMLSKEDLPLAERLIDAVLETRRNRLG